MKTLQHYIDKINGGEITKVINSKHIKVLIAEVGQTREYDVKMTYDELTIYTGCDKTFLLQAQLVIGINGTNKIVWGCESNAENGELIVQFQKWYTKGFKEDMKREDKLREIIEQF